MEILPRSNFAKPPKKPALTNAEHQARYRARQADELRRLRAVVAAHHLEVPAGEISSPDLRKTSRGRTGESLRKDEPALPDLDDQLTLLRRRGEELVREYAGLATTAGLSQAQIDTIAGRFAQWHKAVKALKIARPVPITAGDVSRGLRW